MNSLSLAHSGNWRQVKKADPSVLMAYSGKLSLSMLRSVVVGGCLARSVGSMWEMRDEAAIRYRFQNTLI